ncbi:hypothetical protein ACJMK2_028756 [Sinanodonta woodiana]|uniref:Uncharacterized protein n=1 Tax=Sinanodonta woodiana TaxID=1069815 RepID=A0ABD3XBN5_SINWO
MKEHYLFLLSFSIAYRCSSASACPAGHGSGCPPPPLANVTCVDGHCRCVRS